MSLDHEALETLAELANRATPGPWVVPQSIHGDPYITEVGKGRFIGGGIATCDYRDDYGRSNAAFIAAAREAVPALVMALREARAEVERLSKYAPSPIVAALLERSSLGSEEAKSARDSVSPDAGHAVVHLSKVMAERDALRERLARVKALALDHFTGPISGTVTDWVLLSDLTSALADPATEATDE